jgi:putative hydrolase of the HAD superfamily
MSVASRRERQATRACLFDAAGTLFALFPPIPERIVAAAVAAGMALDENAIGAAFTRAGSLPIWPEDQQDHQGRVNAWTTFLVTLLDLAGASSEGRLTVEVAEQIANPQSYRLFPDVLPVLESLATSGIPLQIVSNFDHLLLEVLAVTGINKYFPEPVFSGRLGIYKPDPRIFGYAADQLGLSPGECTYVGDSPRSDVRGAEGAGMHGVLIDRSNRVTPAGMRRINDLRELLSLFNHM